MSLEESKLEASADVVHEIPFPRRVSVTVIVSSNRTAFVGTSGVIIEVKDSLVGTEIAKPPDVYALITNSRLVTSARAIDVAGKTNTNVAICRVSKIRLIF